MHDFIVTNRKRRGLNQTRAAFGTTETHEKRTMKRGKSIRRESDNRDNGGGGWSSREEKKTAGPGTRKAP